MSIVSVLVCCCYFARTSRSEVLLSVCLYVCHACTHLSAPIFEPTSYQLVANFRDFYSSHADMLTLGNRAMQRWPHSVGHMVKVQGVAYGNVWVSSVRDVLFDRKSNGLGIYVRMSGVVALGSLLVQITHTKSGPASGVGGQGRCTLRRTGGNQSKEWLGNRGARCVHMWVPPACMTLDNWACPRGMDNG